MNQSSGVGGPTPHESSKAETHKTGEDAKKEKVREAFTTPVATMEQLRAVLIKNLGEKAGAALFDNFSQSMIMMMFQTTQQSIDHAQQTAKKARQGLG